MIMKSVQILQKVFGTRAQYAQNLVIAGLDTKLKEKLTKQFEYC